jgi:uncharacterized glyoxalase superfamily protein PhnB
MAGAELHAYLSYRDADAALAWLEAVGFEVVLRQPDADGGLAHAEVRRGDVALMLASADADYVTPPLLGRSTGDGLYLWMPEPTTVDDFHERAVAAGGRSVFPPEDTEWGTRRARVLDPEGKEWSVGTYRPGVGW